MKKKRFFSFILAVVLVFGSITLSKPLVTEAESKAKLKSVKAGLKIGKNVQKQGNIFYIVKGTKAKIAVTPILSKKVKAKTTKSFKSYKKKVITVSKSGVIKAKKEGKAQIKITVKTKKTKKVSKGKKSKKIYVVSLSRSKFNKKFFTADPAKLDPGYPTYDDSNNNNNNNNNSQTKTMQQILDDMTDSNGTLTLTKSFLEKYIPEDTWGGYIIPTEFTKAKRVVLPSYLEQPGFYNTYSDRGLREDVVYVVDQNFKLVDYLYDDNAPIVQSKYRFTLINTSCYYAMTDDNVPGSRTLGFDLTVEDGFAKAKLKNKKTGKYHTFQFEVIRNNKNTSSDYKAYQAEKKALKEALKGCTTDEEKVDAIIALVQSNRVGNSDITYKYNCETYSAYAAEYCNIAGIPCTQRYAGHDGYYGQTPGHINNLILVDGKVYILDIYEGGVLWIPYDKYYDHNCKGKDFSSQEYGNMKGVLDYDIQCYQKQKTHGGTGSIEYVDLLKRAGYNVSY